MWFFNSAAIDRLLAKAPAPIGLEHDGNRYTGRLFDEDAWLQTNTRQRTALIRTSRLNLARRGAPA